MKDILLACTVTWLALILIDPDDSFWRRDRDLAIRYAAAIAQAANGRGFLIGRRIVECIVTDVEVSQFAEIQ